MTTEFNPESHREKQDLKRDFLLLRRLSGRDEWDVESLWNLIDDAIAVVNFQRCARRGWIQLRQNRVVKNKERTPIIENGKWHSPAVNDWVIHFPDSVEEREQRIGQSVAKQPDGTTEGDTYGETVWERNLNKCAISYSNIAKERARGVNRKFKIPPVSADEAEFEGLKAKLFRDNSCAPFEVRITSDGAIALEQFDQCDGASDEYRPATYFRKGFGSRIRMAASPKRKAKRVKKQTIDGTVCYSVADVGRWWPDALPRPALASPRV